LPGVEYIQHFTTDFIDAFLLEVIPMSGSADIVFNRASIVEMKFSATITDQLLKLIINRRSSKAFSDQIILKAIL
jgi:hypothetical protein